MLFLAKSLQTEFGLEVSITILTASEIKHEQLQQMSHEFFNGSFDAAVSKILHTLNPRVMIYDLSLERMKEVNNEVLIKVQNAGCFQIGIDNLLLFSGTTQFTLVPAFRINSRYQEYINERVRWGWDSFLIPLPSSVQVTNNNKLLVLTGSSDIAGLGKILPKLLNDQLSADLEINWVQGPLAQPPVLPQNPLHSWVVHIAPEGLGQLMRSCSYGLSVYGVSLFELISNQVPSVMLSPYNGKDDEDMEALEVDGIALFGSDPANAILRLNELTSDDEKFHLIQQSCSRLMQGTGVNIIAEKIQSLVKSVNSV
jgi:hypothetical protein